jgi:hypothetical protein
MRPAPPRFICSRTYTLFFHRFPVVPKAEFWHNQGMPNRAEMNAAIPDAVLSPAHPESALPTDDPIADRAVTERSARESPVGTSEEIPSGEIGGPAGPEPTRFGDWEKKGRCIDF